MWPLKRIIVGFLLGAFVILGSHAQPAMAGAVVGDLNGDAKVDVQDLQLSVNMVLGVIEVNNVADLDGNGEVNILDVQLLVNIILAPSSDTPPMVSITSPSGGATVSGSVAIQASASDDVGIDRVEFFVDGSKKGSDASSPYEYAWDTATASNGSHNIEARAYDTAGQSSAAKITVTVKNGGGGGGESFRFVVIGDTRSGDSAHSKLMNMVGALDPKPVMVFNTGDITPDGNASQWSNWVNIVKPLNIDWSVDPPQYIGAVGNHDAHDGSWEKNWTSYLKAQQRYGDGKTFSISYGNVLFIVLDSENNSPKSWLEKELADKAASHNWIFAFWHHPPYPFGDKGLDSSRSDWAPLLQEYGTDIIFTGHAHYYTRSHPMYMDGSSHPKRDDEIGVIEVITGGGGASLDSVVPNDHGYQELLAFGKGKAYHFMVFDMDGDTLHMETIDIDGNVIDTLDLVARSAAAAPVAVASGN